MKESTEHILAVIITLAYIAAFGVSCIFWQKELVIVFFVSSMLAITMFHNHSIYQYHRFPFKTICQILKNSNGKKPH